MSGRDGVGRGNRPIETLRDGTLKLAIFRNRGERGDFYSVVPGRIYTDEKTDKVRETSSLSGSELLRMANLMAKGYERIGQFREEARQDAAHDRPEQDQDEPPRRRSRTRERDAEYDRER